MMDAETKRARRRLFRQISKPTVYPGGFVLKGVTQRRAKRCYELAAARMLDDDVGRGWRLVHGVIYPHKPDLPKVPIPHAWIERGGEAWEPVRDQWMPEETFNRLFRAQAEHRYTQRETAKLMLEHNHWGGAW